MTNVVEIKLTPRELQILKLAADGQTYANMASAMFISPSTVRQHASSAIHKLGATNMPQAIATSFRRGILT